MTRLTEELLADTHLMREVVEWDVSTWSAAIRFWNDYVECESSTRVLEIGSRRGGLSLFFALREAAAVICSDFHGPLPEARDLHRRHGVSDRIRYLDADATALPLRDAAVDIVVSKSVLGGIGSHGNRRRVVRALSEIRRVLRPGGTFCFAENLAGSRWHRWLRRRFTSWGDRWD